MTITQHDLKRMNQSDAGYDLATPVDLHFKAGEWQTVDLDVYLSEDVKAERNFPISMNRDERLNNPLPLQNWFMMVVPRSSMGMKYGLRMKNTVGIIDSSYTGPKNTIKACLTTDVDIVISAGTRILQGIIIPFGMFVGEVPPTQVRSGGIGSTGTDGE